MDNERRVTIIQKAEAQEAARRVGQALQAAIVAEVRAGHLTPYEGALCAVSSVCSVCMNEGFTREFFDQFSREAWALLTKSVAAGKVFIRGGLSL